MSKKFKFKNGYEGVLPDDVAAILEKRGEGKIISGEAEKPAKPVEAKK